MRQVPVLGGQPEASNHTEITVLCLSAFQTWGKVYQLVHNAQDGTSGFDPDIVLQKV